MNMGDGGCAFPVPGTFEYGMSLRDWFAGQALAGMLAAGRPIPGDWCATSAYRAADAMLAERESSERNETTSGE